MIMRWPSRSTWPVLMWLTGLTCAASTAYGQTAIEFESLDRRDGRPVVLKAFWLPAPQPAARSAAVALFHGCDGSYDKRGGLNQRMREYAALINQQGMHALVVDSLTPRGETELCTQRVGTRAVTMVNRRLDALASVAWLAGHAEVDAQRIGLIGWSHGGSAVLAATNLRQRDVAAQVHKAALAVAFYPGCEAELRRGYDSSGRLLLLVGEADDWTAPGPCVELARRATGRKPELEAYAGAYHGFDSDAPVRWRNDVPNGVHSGQGVHVGGHPEARRLSRERLLQFLVQP